MTESAVETPSHRWRWLDVVLLMAVLAIAAIVRLAPITLLQSESRLGAALSMDELWHLALSTGRGSPMDTSDRGVIRTEAIDVTSLTDAPAVHRVWVGMNGPATLHPPLYVLSLRVWREIAGGGDVAAQLYSEVWSLVALAFGFAAIRLCFGSPLALLAMLMLAVAPVQVYLAQEVRGYAMMSGVVAIALWYMARVEVLGATGRRGVVLGFLPVLLLLTHYFAFGACVGIAVYVLIRFRGRALIASLVSLACGAIVYAIVWLPFAMHQLGQIGAGDEFLRRTDISLWDRSLAQALAMPFQLLVDRPVAREPVAVLTAVVFVLPLMWWRRAQRLLPWWVVGSSVVASLLLLDALRGTEHLRVVRYASAASTALPPLLLLCVAVVSRRLAYAFGSLAVIGIALFLHAPMGVDSPRFDEITRPLARRLLPGEPLLIVNVNEPIWLADGVSLHLLHEASVAPRAVLKLDRPATRDQLRELLAGSHDATSTAWLVTGTPNASPEQLVATDGLIIKAAIGDPLAGTAFHVEVPPDESAATTRPR